MIYEGIEEIVNVVTKIFLFFRGRGGSNSGCANSRDAARFSNPGGHPWLE